MRNKNRIAIAEITDRVPELPVPLCFTEAALEAVAETVGSKPPETGAFGFGNFERFGIDTVEFDVDGSARSSDAVYAPDENWAETRRKFWLEQDPPKVWQMVAHSHPAGIGRPSEAVGEALGDLGFVAAVFAANEAIQHFAIPIVTRPGSSEARLFPWVAVRGEHGRVELYKAQVRVCAPEEFPAAVYNPEWESKTSEVVPSGKPLDVEQIASLIEGDARLVPTKAGSELRTLRRGVLLRIELPPEFPDAAPRVLLPALGDDPSVAPQGWKRDGKTSPEERLAKLVKETVKWLSRAS